MIQLLSSMDFLFLWVERRVRLKLWWGGRWGRAVCGAERGNLLKRLKLYINR